NVVHGQAVVLAAGVRGGRAGGRVLRRDGEAEGTEGGRRAADGAARRQRQAGGQETGRDGEVAVRGGAAVAVKRLAVENAWGGVERAGRREGDHRRGDRQRVVPA